VSIEQVSRRSVLRGALLAVVGGVAGFLVARASDAADTPSTTTAANGYGPRPAAANRALASLTDVPVGGGVVVGGVVLTRDVTGSVHAFSATCTHQGCTVSGVSAGAIVCPCHGSRFDVGTGAVLQGPANRPLPAIPVQVRNGRIVRS
jgi:Rieske Fe-S protein